MAQLFGEGAAGAGFSANPEGGFALPLRQHGGGDDVHFSFEPVRDRARRESFRF